jgi:hypothetical protein
MYPYACGAPGQRLRFADARCRAEHSPAGKLFHSRAPATGAFAVGGGIKNDKGILHECFSDWERWINFPECIAPGASSVGSSQR